MLHANHRLYNKLGVGGPVAYYDAAVAKTMMEILRFTELRMPFRSQLVLNYNRAIATFNTMMALRP